MNSHELFGLYRVYKSKEGSHVHDNQTHVKKEKTAVSPVKIGKISIKVFIIFAIEYTSSAG